MWQNLMVLVIVGVATSYIGWTIFRGIQGAAGSCGGGCGSGCGAKSQGDNLVQLNANPPQDSAAASPEQTSTVSSNRS